MCKVLQIAPPGYRKRAALVRDPSRRCARAQRDDVLRPRIEQVWNANFQVHGADKVWRQLAREGTAVARCAVEPLMRRRGLRGVMRGEVVRTTVSDSKAPRPMDRVNRQFHAEWPNQLLVSDFTCVSTYLWQRLQRIVEVPTAMRPATQMNELMLGGDGVVQLVGVRHQDCPACSPAYKGLTACALRLGE